jgi:hypothetical protein
MDEIKVLLEMGRRLPDLLVVDMRNLAARYKKVMHCLTELENLFDKAQDDQYEVETQLIDRCSPEAILRAFSPQHHEALKRAYDTERLSIKLLDPEWPGEVDELQIPPVYIRARNKAAKAAKDLAEAARQAAQSTD